MPSVIGGENADYILRVRGDSMIDAGILDGDFVVVQDAEEAINGEIVVALLGEEATVKRFFREKDRIRLQPENKDSQGDPHPGREGARPRGRGLQEREDNRMTTAGRRGRSPPRGRGIRRSAPAEAGVARREGPTRVDDGQTPSTLAESLARAWEDLTSRGRAECLVCGGDLEAEPAAGPPLLGRMPRLRQLARLSISSSVRRPG